MLLSHATSLSCHRTLLRRSWTLQLLLPGLCNAPATFLDAATAASWPLQRSCNAPGRLQLLLPGPLQRSCNAPRRCNCLCNAPATLPDSATAASRPLQRSATQQLLLQRTRTLQLLLHGLSDAPATLLDAATAASSPLQRSRNAPGHCNCCFLASVDHVT